MSDFDINIDELERDFSRRDRHSTTADVIVLRVIRRVRELEALESAAREDAVNWRKLYEDDVRLDVAQNDLSNLRKAAREFLDASEAAAKPMNPKDTPAAAKRWQKAGFELRKLIGSIV